jgi:polygalacturonase
MSTRRDLLLAAAGAALTLPFAASGQTLSQFRARPPGPQRPRPPTPPPADPWGEAAAIVRRIRRTSFPDRDFPATDFGADGEAVSDSSEAFAKAIAACQAAGGGRVVVPAGDYLTGPIHLKSNVNLHLAEGAVVRFKTDPKAYLPLVFTRWEGIELMNYSPFVYAIDQQNIAITGKGVLDGQCSREHWWTWKGPWKQGQHGWREGMPDQRAARAVLFQMAEDEVPVGQRRFGEGHYLRPPFIQTYRCDRVLIEGVSLRRSPFWQVHPVLCTNVVVRGLDINSHGPNNDGLDPESCRDMLVEDCFFSTGDDCIALNSGRNHDGRRLNRASENIVVRNCRMADGHGGLTIGSQISGHARNVFFENCRLDSPGLNTAIRFKNNALRGGVVENIYFRNITVGQVARSVIEVDFNYEEGRAGGFIPVLRNVVIEKLAVGKAPRVADLQGFEHAPIYDITLRNSEFRQVAQPSVVKNVRGLRLENVRVNGRPATALA